MMKEILTELDEKKSKKNNNNSEYDFVRIKNLRQRPKSKKFVIEITTSDEDLEEEYTIDEDVIIKYYVFKDKEYTVKEFKEILKEMKLSNLFNKCINYLSYSPKSTHEIYKYLDKQNEDKALKQADLGKIVGRLKDLNYLDDNQYAANFVSYYKASKGPKYIEQALLEKGVKQDVIDNALYGYEKDEEIYCALKIAIKYTSQNRKYPFRKQEQMLMRKLLSDGFNSDTINKVISKIEFVDESDDNLIKDINKQIKRLEGKELSKYERDQKIIASLVSKGYDYRKVVAELKNIK